MARTRKPMDPAEALERALRLAKTPDRKTVRKNRQRAREKRAKEVARAADEQRIERVREKLRQARAEVSRCRPRPSTEEQRQRRNTWFKERAAKDPIFKLNRNVRHAVNQSLNSAKRGRKWQELVGFTIDDLRGHLESQFVDGMGWHNIGEWHVDHVRPLSSFNIESADCPEFKAAWALSNLQPLWAIDNMRKGAKWSYDE